MTMQRSRSAHSSSSGLTSFRMRYCAASLLPLFLTMATISTWCGRVSRDQRIVGKWSRLDETWPAQKSLRGLGAYHTVAIEFHMDGSYQITEELVGEMPGTPKGKYRIVEAGASTSLILDGIGVDSMNVSMHESLNLFTPPSLTIREANYTIDLESNKLTLKNNDIGESTFLRVRQ